MSMSLLTDTHPSKIKYDEDTRIILADSLDNYIEMFTDIMIIPDHDSHQAKFILENIENAKKISKLIRKGSKKLFVDPDLLEFDLQDDDDD